LTSNECAPYKGTTRGVPCSDFKNCKPEARVQYTYDVGGAYGKSSEKHMMKEILRNGPLNTEFQAPNVFATYKGGIIDQNGFERLH
jgi:hypothetical protein